MKPRKTTPLILLCLAVPLSWLGGCDSAPPERETKALIPTRAAVSADDGMILLDYPGPKGQIRRRDGATDNYCDVPGLLRALRDAEHSAQALATFVQPFDDREWKSYADGWVETSRAGYVMGSRKMEAMGPTLVTFLDAQKSETFVKFHGGRILKYADIDAATLRQVALLARKHLRDPPISHDLGLRGMSSHRMSTAGQMNVQNAEHDNSENQGGHQ